MGRFDIARGREPFDKAQQEKKEAIVSLKDELFPFRKKADDKSPLLYNSPPMYQIEEQEIQTEQRSPVRVVTMQWPNGHRSIFSFRNFNITITESGEITFYVTPGEAKRIAEDLEKARGRFSDG